MRLCQHCGVERAVLRRPKTFEQVRPACSAVAARARCEPMRAPAPPPAPQICRACFYAALEDEVHQTIATNSLFKPGQRVAVAASGGKDSTVLAHMMTLLNARHG